MSRFATDSSVTTTDTVYRVHEKGGGTREPATLSEISLNSDYFFFFATVFFFFATFFFATFFFATFFLAFFLAFFFAIYFLLLSKDLRRMSSQPTSTITAGTLRLIRAIQGP